jgi:hypothetical protein
VDVRLTPKNTSAHFWISFQIGILKQGFTSQPLKKTQGDFGDNFTNAKESSVPLNQVQTKSIHRKMWMKRRCKMSTTNKSQERVCPSCIADQKKIMSCFGLLTSWPNGLHSLSKAEFHREGPSFHHTNPSTSLDQQSQIIAKNYSSIKL